MATKRSAFYTNEAFEVDDPHLGRSFELAMVIENEPGYYRAGLYSTLEKAQEMAASRNKLNGRTDDEVSDIVASSMAAQEEAGIAFR